MSNGPERKDEMTEWQPIETAPKDGTPVMTGVVGPMSIGGLPSYPLTSRYIAGKWHANFGSDDTEQWAPYDPQPTVWRHSPAADER